MPQGPPSQHPGSMTQQHPQNASQNQQQVPMQNGLMPSVPHSMPLPQFQPQNQPMTTQIPTGPSKSFLIEICPMFSKYLFIHSRPVDSNHSATATATTKLSTSNGSRSWSNATVKLYAIS